jgi:hypothetical protein
MTSSNSKEENNVKANLNLNNSVARKPDSTATKGEWILDPLIYDPVTGKRRPLKMRKDILKNLSSGADKFLSNLSLKDLLDIYIVNKKQLLLDRKQFNNDKFKYLSEKKSHTADKKQYVLDAQRFQLDISKPIAYINQQFEIDKRQLRFDQEKFKLDRDRFLFDLRSFASRRQRMKPEDVDLEKELLARRQKLFVQREKLLEQRSELLDSRLHLNDRRNMDIKFDMLSHKRKKIENPPLIEHRKTNKGFEDDDGDFF